jgi:hypothetical protein
MVVGMSMGSLYALQLAQWNWLQSCLCSQGWAL